MGSPTGVVLDFLLGFVGVLIGSVAGATLLGGGTAYVVWRRLLPADGSFRGVARWSIAAVWCALVLGWFWSYHLLVTLAVGAVVAVVVTAGLRLASTRSWFPDPPGAWAGRNADSLTTYGAALIGVLFLFVSSIWWFLLQALLYGLPVATKRAVGSDLALFVFILLLPLYAMIALLAVVLSLPGSLFTPMERGCSWLADQFAVIQNESERAAVEAVNEQFQEEAGMLLLPLLLVTIAVTAGVWFGVSTDAGVFRGVSLADWMLLIFGLVQLALLVLSVRSLVRVERHDLERTTIRKAMHRSTVKNLTILPLTWALLLPAFVLGDGAILWYAHHLKPQAITVVSPATIEALAHRPEMLTPSGIADLLSWAAFYAEFRRSFGALLFRLLFPMTLVLVLIPSVTIYVYFKRARSLLTIAGTFVVFVLLNLTVQLAVTGAIFDLNRTSLVSALGLTAAVNLTDEFASWLKDLWGYLDCPACDEQIDADAQYCPHCGTTVGD